MCCGMQNCAFGWMSTCAAVVVQQVQKNTVCNNTVTLMRWCTWWHQHLNLVYVLWDAKLCIWMDVNMRFCRCAASAKKHCVQQHCHTDEVVHMVASTLESCVCVVGCKTVHLDGCQHALLSLCSKRKKTLCATTLSH